jgi:DNA polymerase-3 subunit beta
MIEMSGETLSEMINKTIYSVTLEEAGFKLSGVFTEKFTQNGSTFLRMVATDGHRLSMIDKAFSNVDTLELGDGVMIPKKGMNEINKLASEGGKVHMGFKENSCLVKTKDAILVMRLLETKFPDYHAVIPDEDEHNMMVNRASLLEAMRKMLILSNERYRAVKVTLENDMMGLVSTNPDLGEAEENIEVKYRGDRLEAGFNPRYFVDILQPMESEMIELGFVDDSKPCVIRGKEDEGFLGLIMPMKV